MEGRDYTITVNAETDPMSRSNCARRNCWARILELLPSRQHCAGNLLPTLSHQAGASVHIHTFQPNLGGKEGTVAAGIQESLRQLCQRSLDELVEQAFGFDTETNTG